LCLVIVTYSNIKLGNTQFASKKIE